MQQQQDVPWFVVHAKKQRRLCNDLNKNLVCRLDKLLPPSFKRKSKRNGAGHRSVGKNGRAMNDVLEDLRSYVRFVVQDAPCTVPALADVNAPAVAKTCIGKKHEVGAGSVSLEQVLSSGNDILCLEVEMCGGQDWIVRSNRGAECLWSNETWGGSVVGSSLSHLVHRRDMNLLCSLYRQCTDSPRAPGRPKSPSTIRFLNFGLVPLASRRILTCKYRAYDIQIHSLSARRNDTCAEHRILIIGCPLTSEINGAEDSSSAESLLEDLLSAHNLHLINGLFVDFNVALNSGELISPGMMRKYCFGGVGLATGDEVSFLERISGIKAWCMQTWTDWCYRFLQYHNELVLDDDDCPR